MEVYVLCSYVICQDFHMDSDSVLMKLGILTVYW